MPVDLVMPMCNMFEYCSNYSDTTGSLWFYSKHAATNCDSNIEDYNAFSV